MYNKLFKKLATISVSSILIFTLAGCGNNTSTNSATKKEKPKQTTQVKKEPVGVATDLGAGTFSCPDNIKPGVYDVSIVGASNGYMSEETESADTSLSFTHDNLNNDNTNDDDMHSIVDKMRLKIVNGSKLTINDINKVHFEPVKSQPEISDTTINAGRYENLKPGRYQITALYGDGAIYLTGKDGSRQQQILSDGVAGSDPKTASITIKKGDVIFNSGIRQVQFKRIGDK